jgi:hypothetical protein
MSEDQYECPICGHGLQISARDVPGRIDAREFECAVCGRFRLTAPAEASLNTLLPRHHHNWLRLSHYVCWMRRDPEPPLIDVELLARLLERPLPDLAEQADKLVLWLGRTTLPGRTEQVRSSGRYEAIVGALTSEGLEFVVRHLSSQGLLEARVDSHKDGWSAEVRLSFAGWQYHTELTRGSKLSRRAFMAMQYGNPTLNHIVEEVFKPAVRQTGFELSRLDDENPAGLIDDRLRVEIRRARFLIADLTHGNEGAYWEAGFAEAYIPHRSRAIAVNCKSC